MLDRSTLKVFLYSSAPRSRYTAEDKKELAVADFVRLLSELKNFIVASRGARVAYHCPIAGDANASDDSKNN